MHIQSTLGVSTPEILKEIIKKNELYRMWWTLAFFLQYIVLDVIYG